METLDRPDRGRMKRNWLQHSGRSALVRAGAAAGVFLFAALDLHAEDGKSGGGSPLDTIAHTKIWADVPEAKDFVRQSRPSSDALDYEPTGRADPKRPAPRTKSELEALQSELERGVAHNEASAGRRKPAKSALAPNARKAKVESARSN
jgi:hypothetical protein